MRKHLHPDNPAFVIRKSVLFIMALVFFSFGNRAVAQCNIAPEGSTVDLVSPSGCNNGSFNLGAGAYYYLTVQENTYYNFSWANTSTCINGFCAVPQNGNASSFTTNQTGWASGTTNSLLVSAERNGCFPPLGTREKPIKQHISQRYRHAK